jgi:hypothetical protein
LVDGNCQVGEMGEIKATVIETVVKGLGRLGKVAVYLKPVNN